MLYLIGLGLGKNAISLEGFNVVKMAKKVYLEGYTSVIETSLEELEESFGKKIIEVDRDFVEKKIDLVLKEAKNEDVAFLVGGDIYSGTTHVDVFLRARKSNVKVKVIGGVSILTSVGIIGLSLYNYGKVVSIPFDNKNVKSAYKDYLVNKKNGLHTLFLLDLDPMNRKFLSIKEGCEYLIRNGEKEDTLSVGCARLGFKDYKIKKGSLENLKKEDFGKPPYCLIIPGKMHFMEEEALDLWK